jgi:hypothetical protein
MFRLLIALFLLLMLIPVTVASVTLTVIPASPTDHDSVVLRIDGGKPDTCWELTGFECLGVDGFVITIDVFWTDHWQPGLGCGAMVVDFVDHCVPGQLPPGLYTVVVNEHADSLREPATYVQEFNFLVDSVVGVPASSWGSIKMIHR